MQRLIDGEQAQGVAAAAQAFVDGSTTEKTEDLGLEDEQAEEAIDADEEATAEAASVAGAADASAADLRKELAAVDEMLALAENAARAAGCPRAVAGRNGSRPTCSPARRWNDRRLIIFTEWEDTRRWLERRLREALADTDRADERIGVFTGATGQDRREEVKAAFNADPAKEPLRILICTDAAREGINLQTYCSDLIHFDLPWNPSRLEQRNGRIDRKLQPAKQVFCRYFRYEQREADIVLEALVRKTEVIQTQLGSAGQVIEERIADRLAEGGIDRGAGARRSPRRSRRRPTPSGSPARARRWMTRSKRALRAAAEGAGGSAASALEDSRERVGVDADDLQRVVGAALGARRRSRSTRARGETVGNVATFTLRSRRSRPSRKEAGWQDAFDDLRVRPRKRGERLNEWRKRGPIRAIAFEPPRLPDGRDAPDVVQVHLEHRLVRRLLSRFLSQGFQSGLSRISVIEGPGAQPRVVLMGRLAVYGAGAARLHEEIIPVTAIWTEAERDRKPLRPLGESGEERTLNQLEEALREARAAPSMAVARVQALVERDIADLVPALERIAAERLAKVKVAARQARRGGGDDRWPSCWSSSASASPRPRPSSIPTSSSCPASASEERREREADRRHWQSRLARLETGDPRRAAAHPRLLRRARASAGAGRARLSLAGVGLSAMAAEIKRDPDLEWLDHVRPVGLVVAPILLKELGLAPTRQTQVDTAAVAEHHRRRMPPSPRCRSLGLLRDRCWAGRRAMSPAAPAVRPCPTICMSACPSMTRRSSPTWAVKELGDGDRRWQLLVRIERRASIPMRAARSTAGKRRRTSASSGCCARPASSPGCCSPRRTSRRTARTATAELRLVYAPRGETSGYLTFPLRALAHRRRPADARRPQAAARLLPPVRRRRRPPAAGAAEQEPRGAGRGLDRARRAGARRAARAAARARRRRARRSSASSRARARAISTRACSPC